MSLSLSRSLTLDELCQRATDCLAVDYGGVANGQVRDVPDRRTVRYYTTLGLIDRPTIQGRTAYYGWRHLLQLVAIKRLQASGKSLNQVQMELAGRSDAELETIARIPVEKATTSKPAEKMPAREPFWKQKPVEPPPDSVTPPASPLTGIPLGPGVFLLVADCPPGLDATAIQAAAGPLLKLLSDQRPPRNDP
jgi:hypothetical protein